MTPQTFDEFWTSPTGFVLCDGVRAIARRAYEAGKAAGKEVPMRYKRMEHNAQLQGEVARLEAEVARLKVQQEEAVAGMDRFRGMWKALEQQLANRNSQWEKESVEADHWSDKCASLEEQNIALLSALNDIADHAPWGGEVANYIKWMRNVAQTAIDTKPAALLAARDRKRDTALILGLTTQLPIGEFTGRIRAIAAARLDGSWVPELGDGS